MAMRQMGTTVFREYIDTALQAFEKLEVKPPIFNFEITTVNIASGVRPAYGAVGNISMRHFVYGGTGPNGEPCGAPFVDPLRAQLASNAANGLRFAVRTTSENAYLAHSISDRTIAAARSIADLLDRFDGGMQFDSMIMGFRGDAVAATFVSSHSSQAERTLLEGTLPNATVINASTAPIPRTTHMTQLTPDTAVNFIMHYAT